MDVFTFLWRTHQSSCLSLRSTWLIWQTLRVVSFFIPLWYLHLWEKNLVKVELILLFIFKLVSHNWSWNLSSLNFISRHLWSFFSIHKELFRTHITCNTLQNNNTDATTWSCLVKTVNYTRRFILKCNFSKTFWFYQSV